ncbi:MAG: protein kinase [Rhodobacterales bacterium]|nr:protein kinase [Rhodobacterales bacterium]
MRQGFIGQTQMGSERRVFRVHRCLGRGGFGEVYRATMESSGGVATEVAIKVLRSDIDPGSDSVKRLRDEGRLLGKLSHPSIVKVHDLVLLENRVSLVTEFIDGEDLDSCFKGAERLPARALVMAIGEVASALEAAWSSPSHTTGKPLQLIHRDVKPANIRIGRHGEIKLLDFGIARAGNAVREAQTAANAMMGSYLYMAPERFHEDDIETPSDVFALGAVLYEGLAGERFFSGLSLQQVYAFMLSPTRFRRRLEERVAELALDVPEDVLTLLGEMMHPDPDERPSAADVSQRCEDLAETLPGATLKRWCRKRDWPDSSEYRGSLDGRVLTAGTVGTMEPAPMRGSRTPSSVSRHISNAPSAPAYSAPLRATPPVPSAPPVPQSLGAAPVLATQRFNAPITQDDPTEEIERRPPTADESLGLGEPGLGDMRNAHADADGGGHVLSFGTQTADVIDDDEAEFDAILKALAVRRKRWTRLFVGLIMLMGTMGAVGVALITWSQMDGPEIPVEQPELSELVDAIPEDVIPEDVIPEDATPEDATPDEAIPDEETPTEGTPDEVAPESEPTPTPKEPSVSDLVASGWDKVGSDPQAAKGLFQQALDIKPGHSDAIYGLGYACMEAGDLEQAVVYFCKALDSGNASLQGEVKGIMLDRNLSWP